MSELARRPCIPCTGGVPPLARKEQQELLDQLAGGWRLVEGHHLEKEYRFPDFRQALGFTMRAGEVAEAAGHHPDINLSWGLVRITIWTHKINGLTEADFVLAARLDEIPR